MKLWFALMVCASSQLLLTGCRKQTPADYRARIGLAARENNRICMTIANAKLLPAATITLLAPAGLDDHPATTARALISQTNAMPCLNTSNADDLSSYDLKITSGEVLSDLPMIAFDARVPSVYAAHSFHACVNAAGIHLTAWDGAKPLEGHRLWKDYFFSRLRLPPNCTAAEISP